MANYTFQNLSTIIQPKDLQVQLIDKKKLSIQKTSYNRKQLAKSKPIDRCV